MLENLQYVFYGALVFQVAFMFILFLQHQRKAYYIYYALYVLGILLAMEPGILGVRNAFVFLVEWPVFLVYFLFLDAFLGLSGRSPTYRRFIYYLKLFVVACLLLQFGMTFYKEYNGPMERVDQWTKWFDDFYYYTAYCCGAYALYETYLLKNTLSKYILAGTSCLLVGVMLNRLFFQTFDVVPVVAGTFVELLLFSAAIGYKANVVEVEKRQAHEQLMKKTLIALRDQMSPHFVANCLNSIKLLIQQRQEKEAIEYLTEFSKLYRLIVDHFQDLKISLERELDICRSYLEMEKLRFKQSFDYRFDIHADANLLSFVEIPPLLFQPIIENAIWHGLAKKEGAKSLDIRVEAQGACLRCIIEDNGVGRRREEPLPPSQANRRPSTGLDNTLKKIKVFNELYHARLDMQLIDKYNDQGRPSGLRVVFTIFYD